VYSNLSPSRAPALSSTALPTAMISGPMPSPGMMAICKWRANTHTFISACQQVFGTR
jgi:hypothetical protein